MQRGVTTVAAACVALAAGRSAPGQVQIGDTEFVEADWTHVIMWSVPSATLGPMTREASGGNPGAFQRGRHVTQGPFATIYDGHFFVAQSYDPGTQGAIEALDIAFDYIDFSPGGVQNGLAVLQGGTTYIRFVDSAGPHAAWVTLSHAGITQTDNQWMEASASGVTQGAPDYSAAGDPMQFGYYTFNWSLPTGFLIDRQWGIDNFRITIHVDACYPDCNGVGGLTIADFGCFQTRFVAGEPYADCNGVGGLTIADFGCFQTAFVGGCP
jgi:hypothetical protein